VQVQTYGAGAPHKVNVWVLWSRLAHGNQATLRGRKAGCATLRGQAVNCRRRSSAWHRPSVKCRPRRRIHYQPGLLSRGRPDRDLLFAIRACRAGLGDGQRHPRADMAQSFVQPGRRQSFFGLAAAVVVQAAGKISGTNTISSIISTLAKGASIGEPLQVDYFAANDLLVGPGIQALRRFVTQAAC